MDLATFQVGHAAQPWQWGKSDCCLVLADWYMAATGDARDPAAHVRGAYATEIECRKLIADAGGLVALIESIARPLDLPRMEVPRYGAIGVIGSRHREGMQFGAIHDGSRWHLRWEIGWTPIVAPPLAIWWVECQPS